MAERNDDVILNVINPGLCHSDLVRDHTGFVKYQMAVLKGLVARTTEMGSRTLVHAATAGPESHGLYFSDCDIH
jgi:retinol dehydrogenase-12